MCIKPAFNSVLSVFIFLCFFSSNSYAASILVSSSGEIGYRTHVYGGPSWDNLTSLVDLGADTLNVVSDYENLAQMMSYDALWLDQRYTSGSLSLNEINNISTFIDTGRRVVMFGENTAWASWNEQILGIVGGTFVGNGFTNIQSPITAHELTDNVSSISAVTFGVANGGTSLFEDNFVTLWGDNVLTILDVGMFADGNNWNSYDNAQFGTNVAAWITNSTLPVIRPPTIIPVPAAIWLFASGLIGLIGIARHKKA